MQLNVHFRFYIRLSQSLVLADEQSVTKQNARLKRQDVICDKTAGEAWAIPTVLWTFMRSAVVAPMRIMTQS